MKITNVAIKYRTSIVVLTLILVVGGLLSYLTIPKESAPSIEFPNIVVTTIYPGASPDDIESLITQKIEQEIQGVNGIKEIRSTSVEGVSTVIIEFDPDVSMEEAFQKVRDKVDVAKAELPTDVEEPLVSEIDISEFPIMTINLAAGYSLTRLKQVAEDLQDRLEAIPSVLEVDLVGGLEREVQVNVDLAALQGYNLAFDDLANTIRDENANIPGGSVDVDRLNYLVRVDGEIKDPEKEISDLVVKAPGGQPVYVRDVADVVVGYKKRASYARLRVLKEEDDDGALHPLPAEEVRTLQVISLNVKKRSGDNIIETAAAARSVLDATVLPGGTEVVITGDQSEQVEALVKDLENNIISGLIFVVAVLLFFLGVRNATLVGIAIPLSMFVSFIVFQALGNTLNFISLFSLIIALGMLVDNAIVIVENIFRFREEGYTRFEAARLGTAEVAGPVVASTATTVAAFAPMLLWPGIIGEFMSYMPLTLIITLSSSLFVALVINPVVTGIFVRLESEERKPATRAVKVTAAAVVGLFGVMLALANWKTLLVLAVAVPTLYLGHRYVFKPVGDRFVREGLPRIIARYRVFLSWMLQRDYTGGRRSYLRNTLALALFTLGFLLVLLSAVFSSMVGPKAGLIFLVPGGAMLLLGLLGIFLHTLESIFLGGKTSVKVGLFFGGVMLTLLTLMYFSPRQIEVTTIVELMILPLVIVVVGFLGMLLKKPERQTLILTDNRARLLTGALGALFSIILMFAVAPTGVAFFPDSDPSQIRITIEGELGTNIEASNRIAETAEARIDALLADDTASQENTKNMLVNVGVGGDAFFGGGASGPERSSLTLNLVDYADRPEPSPVTLARLRAQLQGIPGTEIEFSKDQQGPPTGAPVNIEISGEDFDQIKRITQEVRQRLREASETGAIAGLVDVTDNLNTGRPEVRLNIDRERAARFGLSTSKIASTVRSAINGAEVGKYRTGEDEYDIRVRLRESDRASLESINNLTILEEGQQIPITAVADFEVGGGLGSITRLDLKRVATVQADAAPGYNGNAVLAQVQALLAPYEQTLPPGYTLTYTGANEEQQESFGFLTTALLIGVALIFLIMVAQFNSVSGPFIIIVAVGLSLTGVLLGLIITRTPFSLFTFIGIISLAGIVVNNNIVLIDYIMQLRERGLSKQQAIVEGGATRLRPVLLTALTTVLGLAPLTFGINIDFVGLLTNLDPDFQIGSENTQFWGPMGIAIISGLTFGTFLTLVIVPVMYSVFDSVSLRLGELFSGQRAGVPAAVPVVAGDGLGAPVDGAPVPVSEQGTGGNGAFMPPVGEPPPAER